MADAPPTQEHEERDAWGMTPAMHAEHKAEDSEAWRNVVGVLLLIVSIGLVLAVITVFLTR